METPFSKVLANCHPRTYNSGITNGGRHEETAAAQEAYDILVKNTKEAVEMYFLSAGIVI